MNVKFNRNLRFGHPAPDPRNRPHMHHAIEPWMVQVRVLGTPAATKKTKIFKQKLTNVGMLSEGGNSEVDFGKPPGFVARLFVFSALDFFSGVDIPDSSK